MRRFIRNIFSKGSQKFTMLVLEIFMSFIALYIILSFIIMNISNSLTPIGFQYENVSAVNIEFPGDNWATAGQTVAEIQEYLVTYPDVETLGRLYCSFIFFNGFMNPYKPLFYNDLSIDADKIELMGATDEIADVLDLRVTEGRWFNIEDNASNNRPCVISRNLKELIFGSYNALGEIIDYCDQKCVVVGVIENIKHKGDYTIPGNYFIVRHTQVEGLNYELSYCMNGSYCGIANLIKFKGSNFAAIEEDIIRDVFTRFPDYNIGFTSLNSQHSKYLRRTWMPLISVLAVVLFLFLNVLFGLFGVLWYNISLRKTEIGLRMAVGASRWHVYNQFIREMLVLATIGIVPGIIIAAQFPILQVFDIETSVYIIAMLGSAIIIYLLVTLCALLPSAQAAKTQPAMALHEE